MTARVIAVSGPKRLLAASITGCARAITRSEILGSPRVSSSHTVSRGLRRSTRCFRRLSEARMVS